MKIKRQKFTSDSTFQFEPNPTKSKKKKKRKEKKERKKYLRFQSYYYEGDKLKEIEYKITGPTPSVCTSIFILFNKLVNVESFFFIKSVSYRHLIQSM